MKWKLKRENNKFQNFKHNKNKNSDNKNQCLQFKIQVVGYILFVRKAEERMPYKT